MERRREGGNMDERITNWIKMYTYLVVFNNEDNNDYMGEINYCIASFFYGIKLSRIA